MINVEYSESVIEEQNIDGKHFAELVVVVVQSRAQK